VPPENIGQFQAHTNQHLPEDLRELIHMIRMTDEVAVELNSVVKIVTDGHRIGDTNDQKQRIDQLTRHSQVLSQLLKRVNLSATETHLCCGLIAFCLTLRHELDKKGKGRASPPSGADASANTNAEPFVPSESHLQAIAEAFINQRCDDALLSPYHKSCVAWSAIVLGHYLLHTRSCQLRGKGHIILVSLRESLIALCPVVGGKFGWEAMKEEISHRLGSLWYPGLEEQWAQSWHTTMQRQHEWEEKGLLKIGAPLTEGPDGEAKVDLVEYMVLREARDSLPGIDEPEETY
jgi:hypothetical protein